VFGHWLFGDMERAKKYQLTTDANKLAHRVALTSGECSSSSSSTIEMEAVKAVRELHNLKSSNNLWNNF
jgi:hypothetical protein